MRRPLTVIVIGAVAAATGGGCSSAPVPTVAAPGTPGFAGTGFTDFSFVHGVPVAGVRLTACGRITVTTNNTERTGTGAFRGDRSGQPASVTFGFDRTVAAFDLTVSGLREGDVLTDFDVGSPPRLSGTLIQTADGSVTGGATADQHEMPSPGIAIAKGTLSWPQLAARQLTLVARGAPGAAIVFHGFSVACSTRPPAAGESSANINRHRRIRAMVVDPCTSCASPSWPWSPSNTCTSWSSRCSSGRRREAAACSA